MVGGWGWLRTKRGLWRRVGTAFFAFLGIGYRVTKGKGLILIGSYLLCLLSSQIGIEGSVF